MLIAVPLLLLAAGIFAWYFWLAFKHEAQLPMLGFGPLQSIKRKERPVTYWSAIIGSLVGVFGMVALIIALLSK